MRAYTKVIPGRKHQACEDHLFETTFCDSQNNRYGIFIIGDGLSGSAGHYASNLAVNDLGKCLQKELAKGLSPEELPALIKTKFTELDQQSKGKFETTLDSVVIRNGTCYLHHAGDSRVYFVYAGGRVEQVTVDEGKISTKLGPANYLGALKGTNEQIIDLTFVQYIFLTTDGLTSRVTDDQINTLLRTAEYGGLEILNMFERIISQPREKLLQQVPEGKLTEIVKGRQETVPSKKEQLVDLVLQYYGRNQEVTTAVDSLLEYDDTAMILVDLQDSLGKALHEQERRRKDEEERVQQIEQQRNEAQTRLGELSGKYEAEKEARERAEQGLAGLPEALRGLEQRLSEAVKNSEGYRRQLEELQRKYDTDTDALRREAKEAEEEKRLAEEAKRTAEREYQDYKKKTENERKSFEERIRQEEAKKARSEIDSLNDSQRKEREGLIRANAGLEERIKGEITARERAERERGKLEKDYRTEKAEWAKKEADYTHKLSEYEKKKADWEQKKRDWGEEERRYIQKINDLTTEYNAAVSRKEEVSLDNATLRRRVGVLEEQLREKEEQEEQRAKRKKDGDTSTKYEAAIEGLSNFQVGRSTTGVK